MSATAAEFRLAVTFTRLPAGRAYMAEYEVLNEAGEPYYWPGSQTVPAKANGGLAIFVGMAELDGEGAYRVFGVRGQLRELTQPGGSGPALDLDGKPCTFGPVELYREETAAVAP